MKRTKEEISKPKVDMLNGPVAMKILLFALPIAVSGILQQMFNAADVAVVGKFAGGSALAAVGGNSPLVNLFIGALSG
ncbi:MAG: MATE family efflux transporter, partial [Prevotella sp.]|nr:MATE family efflux transporter [Prevotella sp.]